MKKVFKIIGISFLFLFLTIITQIGGIVLLLSLAISKIWKRQFRFKTTLTFALVYLISTFIIVPLIAPIFGREKIVHAPGIQPTMFLTDLLNRNYVNPQWNLILKQTAKKLEQSNIQIKYLDANFPFLNQFPLLPHLSHNDGNKLDISLIYESTNGKLTNRKKSNSGYGVFEPPKSNEPNQIEKCIKAGYFQYNFPKYLTLGKKNQDLTFSNSGTKKLVTALLRHPNIQKIFIEPHLKRRLGINDSRIRYHGCQAVRHDDHIHVQIK